MIVAYLIASFQAMDDDFATCATYSRSGPGTLRDFTRLYWASIALTEKLGLSPWLRGPLAWASLAA